MCDYFRGNTDREVARSRFRHSNALPRPLERAATHPDGVVPSIRQEDPEPSWSSFEQARGRRKVTSRKMTRERQGSINSPPHQLRFTALHPIPGASLQNYVLSKFHVSIASAVCVNSKLWNPSKIWAVIVSHDAQLSTSVISNLLPSCFGDRPSSFDVCSFGPRIFTFQVANSNVAVELLLQGTFCDRTTSKMRGFVSQDHIGGFSTKRECANTHK
jgi:hypothetical protein